MKLAFSAFLSSAFLATAILIGAPDTAHANQEELGRRLLACKEITSILTRAECYDSVVTDFDLVNMNQVDIGASGGKWKVTKERSPVTGNDNYYAILPSNDYVQNVEGKFKRPSLVLRCTDSQFSGYVVWDMFLSQEKTVLMNIRMGSAKTEAEHWELSADRTAVFIKKAEAFSQRMFNQDGMFLTAWPDKNPLNASFDLRGTSVALKPLLDACPIKPATPAAQ